MEHAIEIAIYVVGCLAVWAGLLWAGLWLAGRIIKLLGYWMVFIQVLHEIMRRRKR